ncbi:MAG: hypothetical protein AAF351_12480 [Pseudomonadota bacterium]
MTAADFRAREFEFVRVSQRSLEAVAFHDGRSTFSSSHERIRVPIDDALTAYGAESSVAPRLILHSSFCGSTLLSRSLGSLTNVVSYREPQVLIELADRSSAFDRSNTVAHFAIEQFQKTWTNDQQAILKPSNWANTLLEANLNHWPTAKVVVLSQDLTTYLVANLRGGKARMRYSLNLLSRHSVAAPHVREDVEKIERSSLDGIDEVLRLLAIGYRHQIDTLGRIAADRDAQTVLTLSINEMRADFRDTVRRVVDFFDIEVDDRKLHDLAHRSMTHDAKTDNNSERPFEQEHLANQRILRQFDQPLRDTVRWFEDAYDWPGRP